jgi:protein TonB
MAEQGFLAQKPASPTSLVIVIALHGAALTALMLAKTEIERRAPVITKMLDIPEVKPPPPEPVKKVETEQPPLESRIETVRTIVTPPINREVVISQPRDDRPVIFDPGPIGTGTFQPPSEPAPQPQPQPVPEPVRTEAQLDSRSRLQPPYPAAEERAEVTGSVTVLIVIGTDGRVKAVEKLSAASDAFFRATEQQALRHWRFKPAMVDGKPVESRKRMTVHFRLDA